MTTNYTPDEIRSRRIAQGWTQRAFADMIGVTPVAVSKWENGQSEPSYNHMRRIVEVFRNGGDQTDDRMAALERDVADLREQITSQQQQLLDRMAVLLQDAEEYRIETRGLLERLATRVGVELDGARESRPGAE